jgi:hypothetical protein
MHAEKGIDFSLIQVFSEFALACIYYKANVLNSSNSCQVNLTIKPVVFLKNFQK